MHELSQTGGFTTPTGPSSGLLFGSPPKAPDVMHWPFLDLVRFGAALLVLFGHARGLYFESIVRVPDAGMGTRLFYLLTGIHYEGVMLFFVVSGFLVGGSAWRSIAARRFDARRYLTNRFSRIYLVLVPALVLVFAVELLGKHFLADTRFYAMRPLFPSEVADGWAWNQIPCHLAALQGAMCAPWGADPPLWSLGWEWVFYLIAPVLFGIWLLPLRPITRAIALACFGASLVSLFGLGQWLMWFAIWLAGVGAAQLATRRDLPLTVGLAGLALCAAALLVSRTTLVPGVVADLGVGIGLAIAISCRKIASAEILKSVAARGAAFSYSLYLIHLPIGVFVGGLLERLGWPRTLVAPGLEAYTAFTLIVAVSLIAAYLFAQLTEKHTARFRRFLSRVPG
ncbi:MAG: acyltransferase [Hyphomicrobiales bacterium]|nr:acyltransferase [Hyphomicrobiales bacterium]